MGIFEEVVLYLIVINIIAFLAMLIDKKKAEKGKWRISEGSLFALAGAGGSIGGILGMLIFRHKTKKKRFLIGFPAILILQIIWVVVFTFL
ncbi:MAG: DUF1294 domain-containing protein [Clostridia bacterium]|nr:DUF1294 domain-containing protein [Clostridia bacterium]